MREGTGGSGERVNAYFFDDKGAIYMFPVYYGTGRFTRNTEKRQVVVMLRNTDLSKYDLTGLTCTHLEIDLDTRLPSNARLSEAVRAVQIRKGKSAVTTSAVAEILRNLMGNPVVIGFDADLEKATRDIKLDLRGQIQGRVVFYDRGTAKRFKRKNQSVPVFIDKGGGNFERV